MTVSPGAPAEPSLSMDIDDVFRITGRGTVVTGQLQGNVPLNVGDLMVCDDGIWPVSGIEQFRKLLTTAEPGGGTIGILLGKGPPADLLRERTVTFQPGTGVPGALPGAPTPRRRRWFR
jgi:translation elongation factor EF-Tu-like GTPase